MHAHTQKEGQYYDHGYANLNKVMKSKYIDMFDNYFSGELSEQEKVAFEEDLKTDTKLAEAFQEYRNLRQGIDYSIMKSLKEELQELETSLPEVELEPDVKHMIKPAKARDHFRIWKVAAAVVLVSISVAVVFQLQQPSNPQDLFSQYFEPAENPFVGAKRGDDISADLEVQASMAYDARDWSTAIAGFETILGQEVSNEQYNRTLYYLGIAQLAQGQSQAAIHTFEQFLEVSEDNVAEAKWYLALGYLNENMVQDAKILLKELNDGEEYREDTRKILKKLD